MERARRLKIRELGAELTCYLCNGYFVDAFTVVECLHSFCKSCIMNHVKKTCACPRCGTLLNQARLTVALRPDQTLQSVVYKLVPRLFNDEMQRRREFYAHHPQRDRSLSPERRGDVSSQQFVYTLTDPISFSLEYYRSVDEETALPPKRFFQAPAGLSVGHLRKLLTMKHGLATSTQIDILYGGDILSEELIIMDVAYMHNWDRTAPMRFFYRYLTKRPADASAPVASPSKRRRPELAQAAEPESCPMDTGSGDSDKENVENDARAAAPPDATLPGAGAARTTVKPGEAEAPGQSA
ncbi:polycomb complex protein BMI-1-like [Pollicipes pollicipes]|uniref:polycomb complex protein BMI-1-like n=1 Tax=Pollicipes pollicipes TaxID=41117 RepID=UPI001884C9B3|nr:polycomb complex protein BMI-1-like [Pollicipes pollicipes]